MVAESTLMISTGQWAASANEAALLPEAVGPISSTTGWRSSGTGTLAAPQEEFVELGQRNGYPGGPPMVALVGAFSGFHLSQQGVHFLQRQLAVGSNRSVTSHVRDQLVAVLRQYL